MQVKPINQYSRKLHLCNEETGKSVELQEVVFYNDEDVLFSNTVLDELVEKISASGKPYTTTNTVSFELSSVRNARSVDFNKKDHFLNKNILYIYVGQQGKCKGEVYCTGVGSSSEKMYDKVFYYSVYAMVFNGIEKNIRVFNHSEHTESGKEVLKVTSALNDKGIKVDKFMVEKMLKAGVLNLDVVLD